MVIPEHNNARGARTPRLNPIDTIARRNRQVASFSITSSGRALLFINYNANRVGNYLLLNSANLGNFLNTSPRTILVTDPDGTQ